MHIYEHGYTRVVVLNDTTIGVGTPSELLALSPKQFNKLQHVKYGNMKMAAEPVLRCRNSLHESLNDWMLEGVEHYVSFLSDMGQYVTESNFESYLLELWDWFLESENTSLTSRDLTHFNQLRFLLFQVMSRNNGSSDRSPCGSGYEWDEKAPRYRFHPNQKNNTTKEKWIEGQAKIYASSRFSEDVNANVNLFDFYNWFSSAYHFQKVHYSPSRYNSKIESWCKSIQDLFLQAADHISCLPYRGDGNMHQVWYQTQLLHHITNSKYDLDDQNSFIHSVMEWFLNGKYAIP